ncbi:hypothetical protein C2W62_32280 [Candidatus Entotheonella serta]|nr:hypothetical protein C2W62_32280 [Candidatus Entotheonella serta]
MLKGGGQFTGTVNATAIDHHHHLFLRGRKDAHDLVKILTEFIGIKMGHDFIEHTRGTVLHGTDDIEQHTAGDAAPTAVLEPGLALKSLLGVNLILA